MSVMQRLIPAVVKPIQVRMAPITASAAPITSSCVCPAALNPVDYTDLELWADAEGLYNSSRQWWTMVSETGVIEETLTLVESVLINGLTLIFQAVNVVTYTGPVTITLTATDSSSIEAESFSGRFWSIGLSEDMDLSAITIKAENITYEFRIMAIIFNYP